jgi:hypothetical protein
LSINAKPFGMKCLIIRENFNFYLDYGSSM